MSPRIIVGFSSTVVLALASCRGETGATAEYVPWSCEEAWEGMRQPVDWGSVGLCFFANWFPGSLAPSDNGRYLMYSVLHLPSGDGVDPFEPYTASYAVDLRDYSIVRLGEFAGPALTCDEVVHLYRTGDPPPGNMLGACTVFNSGRHRAFLISKNRNPCATGCFNGCGPGLIDCFDQGNENPPPWAPFDGRWLAEGVGSIEGPRPPGSVLATERSALVTWWSPRPRRLADGGSWTPPCAADDAVYPGRHGPWCQYDGPCCRCSSDENCPAGERCTGQTAGGVRYCLAE